MIRENTAMHSKDILEALGILHRAHSETTTPTGDQMVIGGIAVGPSSRYYGVRILKNMLYLAVSIITGYS